MDKHSLLSIQQFRTLIAWGYFLIGMASVCGIVALLIATSEATLLARISGALVALIAAQALIYGARRLHRRASSIVNNLLQPASK